MSKTIGVTGPRGFIAGHVVRRLQNEPDVDVLLADRADFDDLDRLADFASKCDVILHLAAVNRGEDDQVYATNKWLTERLIEALSQSNARPHVVFSSSTQRDRDGAYGKSKRESELNLTLCRKPTTPHS